MTATYGPKFLHIGNAHGTAQISDYRDIGPIDGITDDQYTALQDRAEQIAYETWSWALDLHGLELLPNGETLADAEEWHTLPLDDEEEMKRIRDEVAEHIETSFEVALDDIREA